MPFVRFRFDEASRKTPRPYSLVENLCCEMSRMPERDLPACYHSWCSAAKSRAFGTDQDARIRRGEGQLSRVIPSVHSGVERGHNIQSPAP